MSRQEATEQELDPHGEGLEFDKLESVEGTERMGDS